MSIKPPTILPGVSQSHRQSTPSRITRQATPRSPEAVPSDTHGAGLDTAHTTAWRKNQRRDSGTPDDGTDHLPPPADTANDRFSLGTTASQPVAVQIASWWSIADWDS
ncbi:hypothetical protein GWI33_013131 [Rhynchophorus ferrugineus]|uniref:Uncharacterized protein n=1 Tax=Rhynchophorus ferrugineus TaxID=354439 RepID=A0A834IAC1_RHYFE|nr:hypothetical protein GWI33_013131 [Rhynchophorus ferrugineus]